MSASGSPPREWWRTTTACSSGSPSDSSASAWSTQLEFSSPGSSAQQPSQIFAQHLVEVGLIACTGALLGLAAGALGLAGVRGLFTVQVGADTSVAEGYRALTHFDTVSIAWAMSLAVLSALGAGLYPAWRIGRVLPATYLKSQ
jgi:hypothetical protein